VRQEELMITRGLLVRMEAKRGRDGAVEDLVRSGLSSVRREASTLAWFGVRSSRRELAIFDVFESESALEAHLAGPMARALGDRATELLVAPPSIQRIDILADKIPAQMPVRTRKALLLTFDGKAGHEREVESFLRNARSIVDAEPRTVAWFAFRMGHTYGIFDAFPDGAARMAHLIGHVPRELTKHALSLLGSMPHMRMLDVLAAKLPGEASWAHAAPN
jgi:quinol monooxygenase YgiN